MTVNYTTLQVERLERLIVEAVAAERERWMEGIRHELSPELAEEVIAAITEEHIAADVRAATIRKAD